VLFQVSQQQAAYSSTASLAGDREANKLRLLESHTVIRHTANGTVRGADSDPELAVTIGLLEKGCGEVL
jgi:hypothetical protein